MVVSFLNDPDAVAILMSSLMPSRGEVYVPVASMIKSSVTVMLSRSLP